MGVAACSATSAIARLLEHHCSERRQPVPGRADLVSLDEAIEVYQVVKSIPTHLLMGRLARACCARAYGHQRMGRWLFCRQRLGCDV